MKLETRMARVSMSFAWRTTASKLKMSRPSKAKETSSICAEGRETRDNFLCCYSKRSILLSYGTAAASAASAPAPTSTTNDFIGTK